jgi:hypothetical protein
MRQASARRHLAQTGLGRSTVHGVVFAFCVLTPPFAVCERIARALDSALQRERCYRAPRDERKSVSIFIERNCSARSALLTAGRCANLFAFASRADSKTSPLD